MANMARRELTEIEKKAALTLRDFWDDRPNKRELTQEKAAPMLGYTTQGAVNQYLTGKIPLNPKALMGFAALLGVNASDISPELAEQWHLAPSGSSPRVTALSDGDHLDVPTFARKERLVEDSRSSYNTTTIELKNSVPLISWVQAGEWQEAVDNLIPGQGEELVLTDKNVGPHAYALRVSGDSMEPQFPEGAKIIVDPSAEITHRAYVIAKLDGQDVTFKQYMEDGGRRYLKPLNPSYPTMDITELEVTFCGRIIQVITDVL